MPECTAHGACSSTPEPSKGEFVQKAEEADEDNSAANSPSLHQLLSFVRSGRFKGFHDLERRALAELDKEETDGGGGGATDLEAIGGNVAAAHWRSAARKARRSAGATGALQPSGRSGSTDAAAPGAAESPSATAWTGAAVVPKSAAAEVFGGTAADAPRSAHSVPLQVGGAESLSAAARGLSTAGSVELPLSLPQDAYPKQRGGAELSFAGLPQALPTAPDSNQPIPPGSIKSEVETQSFSFSTGARRTTPSGARIATPASVPKCPADAFEANKDVMAELACSGRHITGPNSVATPTLRHADRFEGGDALSELLHLREGEMAQLSGSELLRRIIHVKREFGQAMQERAPAIEDAAADGDVKAPPNDGHRPPPPPQAPW
jgi:hypothetical protein